MPFYRQIQIPLSIAELVKRLSKKDYAIGGILSF
jgi:hypothetical protein